MLNFWFSPYISHLQKFFMCLGVLILTGFSYLKAPMPIETLIPFFLIGLFFVISYHLQNLFKLQFSQRWLARLLRWIPLAILCALIFQQLGRPYFFAWGILGLGTVALTIFLLSPQGFVRSGLSPETNPDLQKPN